MMNPNDLYLARRYSGVPAKWAIISGFLASVENRLQELGGARPNWKKTSPEDNFSSETLRKVA